MGGSYAEDRVLVDALLGGEEQAFAWVLDAYDGALRRAARGYVSSDAVADEVVQETWLRVVDGLRGFERRSSLKTWVYGILLNVARRRGERERRSIPFSCAAGAMEEGAGPAVDPERFIPQGREGTGAWASPPSRPEGDPEQRVLSGEVLRCIATAISALPPAQREVITLRDVEGWTSIEVRNALSLSETNQRVLLHRARCKVRAACEQLVGGSLT